MRKRVFDQHFLHHQFLSWGLILFLVLILPGQVFAAQAEEKAKPKANPVNTFLKNLFGQEKKTARSEKPKEIDQDSVDKKAPQNNKHAEMFHKAQEAFEKQNYDRSLTLIQLILDDPTNSVVFLPEGESRKNDFNSRARSQSSWRTVKLQATELLGTFPESVLRQYELKYGADAKRMLEDSIQQNNLKLLAEVSDRYFHTIAGKEALNLLGNKYLDRGDFSLAYRAFSRLENSNFPEKSKNLWQFKYAFSAWLSGRKKKAENLISQIENPEGIFPGDDSGVPLEKRFENLVTSYSTKEPGLKEWWMMYGSPSRTGRVEKGHPLLLPRWFYPVTENSTMMEKIRSGIEEYVDELVPVIPTIQAITSGDKIAFRSLRGVVVLDSKTGKRIWETRTDDSPEVILEKMTPRTSYQSRFNRFGNMHYHQEVENPLVDVLLDNGTYGSISSDGNQLFIIDNHIVMPDILQDSFQANRGRVPGEFLQKSMTNRLISYDLSNGHIRWSVGGIPLNSRLNQNLPGCYFFGSPVRSGNELFVIGERDNEIHLFALNPDNGELQWSCLLAYSSAAIRQDFVRRTWTAQVSMDQGIIVCPTTVGWIVGVNRLTRSIEWIHRYSDRQKNYDPREFAIGQGDIAPYRDLGYSWPPSAPIISRSKIVYTPEEENNLYCLDLLTGEEIWKHDKQVGISDSIYLAGVFDNNVVMVKRRSVKAYSLENGKQVWTSPKLTSDRLPAGIGVAVGENYYLPMQSGTIKTISLKDGKIKGNTYLRDENYPLGNLVMGRGMLLSLSPYGLSCFEQKDAIQEEIRIREEKNPKDLWATLKKAEIHYLQQEDYEAIETLKQLNRDEIEGEDRQRYDSIIKDSLMALIQSDPVMYEEEAEMLQKLIQTEEDQNQYDRIISERLIKQGNDERAFEVIWKLSQRSSSSYLHPDRYAKTRVLIRNWARVRLEELWQQMSVELQEKLSVKIRTLAETVSNGTVKSREDFLVLFGFHPDSEKIQWQLVNDYRKSHQYAEAETCLRRMLRTASPQKSVQILENLASLMDEAGLSEDAIWYRGRMLKEFPKELMPGGQTVTQYIQQLNSEGKWNELKPAYWGWGHYDWNVSRLGKPYTSQKEQSLDTTGVSPPYFQDNMITIKWSHQYQNLNVQSIQPNGDSWMTPLQSRSLGDLEDYFPNTILNHQIYLVHNDIVHCLSPFEKRIIWTKNFSDNQGSYEIDRYSYKIRPSEMKSFANLKHMNSSDLQMDANGRLGMVTNRYICIYGRREIHVLDPLNGEEIWSRKGISAESRIYGNEDSLLVVSPDITKSLVLNARDGSLIEVEDLVSLVRNNVLINENGWLQLEGRKGFSAFGLGRGVNSLSLVNPLTGKKNWTRKFDVGSHFSLVDPQTLVVLEPSAEMYELNLLTGEKRILAETLTKSEVRAYSSIYTISDQANYYLIVNRRYMSNRNNVPQISSIPVNGQIYAISRQTGNVSWQQEIPSQNLLIPYLNHSPLLVFLADVQRDQNNQPNAPAFRGGPNYEILAIDKQTGRRSVEYRYSSNSYINSMELKPSNQLIELQTSMERIQISATKKHETTEAVNE